MTAIAMIVTGEMTATEVVKTAPLTDVNAPDPLLVAPNTTTVVPGLLRPGEIMMIKGLRVTMIDGTMTGEEVMMIEEHHLTLLMTVVGMMTGVGMTEANAKRKTIATTSDLQDTRTGMVAGRVDFLLV